MTKPSLKIVLMLLPCCTALSWGASALANEPSCELECVKGFACELQIGPCAELPGRECDLTPTPACVPVVCNSDADCAEHMTCYDGNTSDDLPSQCVPRHLLNCNADADCGTGFTCAPLNPCLDPAQPGCVPNGEDVCFITESRACQADSDCLPDWTCENNPLNAFWANTAGESGCNIVDPALICLPPHATILGYGAAGFLDWAKGVQWTHTSVPESQCPAPTSAFVPYGTAGVSEQTPTETGSGVPVNGTSDDSTPVTGMSNPNETPSAQAASGGCSVSSAGDAARERGGAAAAACLLGFIGIALGGRRKRVKSSET